MGDHLHLPDDGDDAAAASQGDPGKGGRREALEEARQAADVEALADEVTTQRKARLARVKQLLDIDHNPAQAAQEVRALMFIDRLLEEIDARLEQYEDAR